VLKDTGKIVILTNLPQLIHLDGLLKRTEIQISLFGETPTIIKFST
jgi:hypothetical protein